MSQSLKKSKKKKRIIQKEQKEIRRFKMETKSKILEMEIILLN
jgi:hypothetical protein